MNETWPEIWPALTQLEGEAARVNGRWLDPAEDAVGLLHDLANGLTCLPGKWDLTEDVLVAGACIKRACDDLRTVWLLLRIGYTAQAAAVCADLWEHCMLAGCCCLSSDVAEQFQKDDPDDRSLGASQLAKLHAKLIAEGLPEAHRPSQEDVEAWEAGDYATYKWLCQLKHPSLRAIVHTSGTTVAATTLGLSAHPDSRDDDRPVKTQILYAAVAAIIEALMLFGVVAVGEHPSAEVDQWKADIERVKEQLRTHLLIEEGDLPFGIFDTKAGRRLRAAIEARSTSRE